MIAETPLLQTKDNQLLSRNWQKHFSYKLNIIKSVSTPRHNVMTVLQRVCSECSDDNGNVHAQCYLVTISGVLSVSVSAEKRSSSHWIWSLPTLEPPRVRSVAADLSRFLRGKSRYQDTQSTFVFPSDNSSHSLFNLPSCWNLETTALKLATAPLVAAPALQYGVWLQVLSGYGQI